MAVASNPLETFIWGAGGQKMSPEQVARQREIAAALMQGGMDYSPVDHWLQGAARASQGLVGGLKERWAGEAEQRGREGFQSQWDSVFGGSHQVASVDPVASALTATDAVNSLASVPSGDRAGYIRSGLIQRGLPEHVADAFLMNFQDESGLNPDINEAQPLVPGSRGGYGLYQLTGPRRRAYEAYAAERGVPVSDIDAQLDFMMSELQGPEARAAQAILSAPDTGSAAAAIVNQFLRPSEQHRARREAAYLRGASMPPGNQVAQAGGNPSVAQLLSLAGNEWANPGQSSVVSALLGQAMQQQDPRYQQQMRMGDLQIQQLENQLNATPFQPRTLTPEEMAQFGIPEGTGSWIMTESGLPQQLYAPPDPTSGIQNFDFLIGQGFDPMDAASRAFSGGVTVNNLPQVGTPPAGFQNVFDDQGRLLRQDMVEGGPAWLEAQQAADAAGRQQTLTGRQILPTIDDIATARALADQPGTLGSLAPALSGVPVLGQTAQDMAATIDAIGSGISLENLNQMRQASPTGGALGNVSDKQSALLSEAFGSLRQSMSRELFLYNLARVENTLNDIVHGEDGGPPRNDMTELRNTLLGGRSPREAEVDAQSQQQPQEQYPNAPAVGEVVEGYRYKGGNPADMSSWERLQ